MNKISKEELEEVINEFQYEGKLVFIKPYGSGHINDTFLLKYEIGYMGSLNVILQRMNREIFEKPVELMENVIGVTEHLKKKIVEMGGDPERETLNLIPAKNGKKYVIDSQGEYWRSYIYITDATSYDKVEKPEDFYESAVAFGKFQGLLSDYPAESLHDTIRGFHDTTPVDVDVLTRLHEYATGIANQNGRHDVRRGEAACIVAGVESVQSYLRRNPGVELEFALIQTDSHPSAHIEEEA